MKKYLFLLIIAFLSIASAFAQTSSKNTETILTPKDSLMLEYLDIYVNQLREPQFKLYPTENIWTFLKLNTGSGQIWQVQYSVDESPRMEVVLDDEVRLNSWDEPICGRFELVPTKNMYNFILLDNIDGRCWQVQWGIDPKDRCVLRIY